MNDKQGGFRVLRGYLDWLTNAIQEGRFVSIEQAREALGGFLPRSSDESKELANELARFRTIASALQEGKIAPSVSHKSQELPLVFSEQDVAFPMASAALQVANQTGCRAALVLNSLPAERGNRYFTLLQACLEAGLCWYLSDAFFLIVALVLIGATLQGSGLLSAGLLLVVLFLHLESKLLKRRLPNARKIFSKFYALSLNPPWPIGNPSQLEKDGKSMTTKEWLVQCLGFAPIVLRLAILSGIGLVITFFVISVFWQVILTGIIGFIVVVLAAKSYESLRHFEGLLNELDRGLNEMFSPRYYVTWLKSLAPDVRSELEEVIEILCILKGWGVTIGKLDADSLLTSAISPSAPGFNLREA